MLPKEIIKKIQRIQIRTNRMVSDVFSGEYQSVFKGRGMEFDEVREYQPGDEVRDIDWNVTARYGRPFIKKFVEERELTVMLLVDASASSRFGTRRQFKSELAAELCAVLAFSAIRNKDKVGLIIFTDRIEKFVPPGKGSRHVLRVIRELLYFQPEGKGTDIEMALGYLNRVTRRRTVSFLVSDFRASGYEKALTIANKRHDIISVMIGDPGEKELPPVGLIRLRDAESGEEILVDGSDQEIRRRYRDRNRQEEENTVRIFRSSDVDCVRVSTDTPYVPALMRFFRQRERRMR
ncbi:MAG: DUF58 domain-containing protein [PVC group bacterium]